MADAFIVGIEGVAGILFLLAGAIMLYKASKTRSIIKIPTYILGVLMFFGSATSMTDVLEWAGILPAEIIDPVEEIFTTMFAVGWSLIAVLILYTVNMLNLIKTKKTRKS